MSPDLGPDPGRKAVVEVMLNVGQVAVLAIVLIAGSVLILSHQHAMRREFRSFRAEVVAFQGELRGDFRRHRETVLRDHLVYLRAVGAPPEAIDRTRAELEAIEAEGRD